MPKHKHSRKHYTEEFKAEAIKMVFESGESVPTIAEQLGIKANQLYAWMQNKRLPQEIKDMINKHKEYVSEIKHLKRQLAKAEQEKLILKKAAVYFAKEAQ